MGNKITNSIQEFDDINKLKNKEYIRYLVEYYKLNINDFYMYKGYPYTITQLIMLNFCNNTNEEKDNILEILKYLYDNGADLNLLHPTNTRPSFIEALYGNYMPVIYFFFNHGASINKKYNGLTPLYAACFRESNLETIKFLLDNGADPNLKIFYDGESICPIEGAIFRGSLKLTKLLTEYGATLDIEQSTKKVRNNIFECLCGKRMSLSIFTYLIENGFDLNKYFSDDPNKPIIFLEKYFNYLTSPHVDLCLKYGGYIRPYKLVDLLIDRLNRRLVSDDYTCLYIIRIFKSNGYSLLDYQTPEKKNILVTELFDNHFINTCIYLFEEGYIDPLKPIGNTQLKPIDYTILHHSDLKLFKYLVKIAPVIETKYITWKSLVKLITSIDNEILIDFFHDNKKNYKFLLAKCDSPELREEMEEIVYDYYTKNNMEWKNICEILDDYINEQNIYDIIFEYKVSGEYVNVLSRCFDKIKIHYFRNSLLNNLNTGYSIYF